MIFGAIGLVFILGVLVFVYSMYRILAQNDAISAALWAAQFSKPPPEQEDV